MDKFDIILLAGQSNAEGCGVGAVENEYIPTPQIMQLDIEKTVEHTPEQAVVTFIGSPVLSVAKEKDNGNQKVGNFSLSFAKAYVENGLLEENRKVLIVRCGIGGTGFKKGHWGLHDAVYQKTLEMLDYALGLHEENRLVAFLWHQGEHDAFEKNPPEVYEKQLRDMLNDVRGRYNVPNLPFIAADFVADWKGKNIEDCAPIVNVIKQVTQTVGNGAFIETSDLLSNDQANHNGDDIHFCRSALYELGKRYFAAFQTMKA